MYKGPFTYVGPGERTPCHLLIRIWRSSHRNSVPLWSYHRRYNSTASVRRVNTVIVMPWNLQKVCRSDFLFARYARGKSSESGGGGRGDRVVVVKQNDYSRGVVNAAVAANCNVFRDAPQVQLREFSSPGFIPLHTPLCSPHFVGFYCHSETVAHNFWLAISRGFMAR